MSCGLAIQTNKYGAITLFDLLYDGRFIASLVKEGRSLVDYSRQRVFQNFDTAIEFYLTLMVPDKNSGLLTIGYLAVESGLVMHDRCLPFSLPGSNSMTTSHHNPSPMGVNPPRHRIFFSQLFTGQ